MPLTLRRAVARPRALALSAGKTLWAVRAETLTAFALLAGWALLAVAVRALLTAYAPKAAPVVWPLAGGVLLLSLAGWGLVLTIARQGLYTLTRGETPKAKVTRG